MGYMRGYETALADWRQFLAQLDAIRLKHKMTIMVLSHAKISTFKNPEGPDYDRFQPDVTPKTWSLTHKWADAVLFWNFEVQLGQVQENRKAGTKKGKLIGQNRICTPRMPAPTTQRIAWDSSPKSTWATVRRKPGWR
jgi:hypothetical protein